MPSAFAFPSCLPFDSASSGQNCAANRSASMDSDISSLSPVPKRHCLYPSQGTGYCHSQLDWHYSYPSETVYEQHPPNQTQMLSSAQKTYVIQAMLSCSCPQEAAAVMAYLQRLQRQRQALSSQHSHSQSAQQFLQHAPSQSCNTSSASTALRLQAAYCQALYSQQLDQQAPHSVHLQPTPCKQACQDGFMTQLQEIQTPKQHQETHSSTISYSHHDAASCYEEQGAVPHPSTVAYEAVQPEAGEHQLVYQQPAQSDNMWQSAASCVQTAAALCNQSSNQESARHVASHLLQMQQQAKMVQQLVHERRVRMQQHMAREQQAFLERQAALPSIRPALGFPELVAYWAKGLSLQRCESVYLACHLWTRVQQQVSFASAQLSATLACHCFCFESWCLAHLA